MNLRLQSDVAFIEKTGFGIATLTAALTDATGAPLAAVSNITFNISSGSGTLSHRENDEVNGLAHIDLSSDKAGEITITAEYELPSGNILSQSVTVASVDLEKDTEGDGFSDGEESLGWTAANEKHVITR